MQPGCRFPRNRNDDLGRGRADPVTGIREDGQHDGPRHDHRHVRRGSGVGARTRARQIRQAGGGQHADPVAGMDQVREMRVVHQDRRGNGVGVEAGRQVAAEKPGRGDRLVHGDRTGQPAPDDLARAGSGGGGPHPGRPSPHHDVVTGEHMARRQCSGRHDHGR
jgi:hypothetical protein